ncbi:MAG: hypothetical protein MI921_28305 [Cytophagales bacterium]|nr:hypothetical protein [Cytophagales bacterium]
MSKKVATNIHRLIADLWHNPTVEEEFNNNRQEVFLRYGLTTEEIEALNNPDWKVLGSLGVFPVSQVIYLLKAVPQVRKHISMRKYIDRIRAEVIE